MSNVLVLDNVTADHLKPFYPKRPFLTPGICEHFWENSWILSLKRQECSTLSRMLFPLFLAASDLIGGEHANCAVDLPDIDTFDTLATFMSLTAFALTIWASFDVKIVALQCWEYTCFYRYIDAVMMILDRRWWSKKIASFFDRMEHPKKEKNAIFLDGYGMSYIKKSSKKTVLDNFFGYVKGCYLIVYQILMSHIKF